jgi:hypothetical protein
MISKITSGLRGAVLKIINVIEIPLPKHLILLVIFHTVDMAAIYSTELTEQMAVDAMEMYGSKKDGPPFSR